MEVGPLCQIWLGERFLCLKGKESSFEGITTKELDRIKGLVSAYSNFTNKFATTTTTVLYSTTLSLSQLTTACSPSSGDAAGTLH